MSDHQYGLGDKGFRKKLHSKRWGNWRYDANDDALYWAKDYPYCIVDFDSVDKALEELSRMQANTWVTGQDMKNLAKALSDLNRCPGLVNSHDVHGHTLSEAKNKVIEGSGSSCDSCTNRFECFTTRCGTNVHKGTP